MTKGSQQHGTITTPFSIWLHIVPGEIKTAQLVASCVYIKVLSSQIVTDRMQLICEDILLMARYYVLARF